MRKVQVMPKCDGGREGIDFDCAGPCGGKVPHVISHVATIITDPENIGDEKNIQINYFCSKGFPFV